MLDYINNYINYLIIFLVIIIIVFVVVLVINIKIIKKKLIETKTVANNINKKIELTNSKLDRIDEVINKDSKDIITFLSVYSLLKSIFSKRKKSSVKKIKLAKKTINTAKTIINK